jgi:hypothetical protein
MPTCRLRANCMTVSTTSEPAEISRTTGFMAESLSLVMIMGGLGLFLEPGGRPLGFFETSGVDPNSQMAMAVLFLGLDGGDEPAGPVAAPERLGTL